MAETTELVARQIVTEWIAAFDPPPSFNFQQSEALQFMIVNALERLSAPVDGMETTEEELAEWRASNPADAPDHVKREWSGAARFAARLLHDFARLQAEVARVRSSLVEANHKIERLNIAAKNHGKIASERETALAHLKAEVERLDRLNTKLTDDFNTLLILESRARDELASATAALHQIDAWAKAYPLTVFPEPDFAKARVLLEAGGMTLDAISASNMRHVVEGVGKIARDALLPAPKGDKT